MMKLYAAPLQGFTEAPWRNAHCDVFGGIEAYYTPFVRIEKGKVRAKDVRDIAAHHNSVPRMVPQLIASSPAELARLVELFMQQGYREADINMGCPFPPIAGQHKGSGILPYPDRVEALLLELRHYPDVHFSVKMRLGWESADQWRALMPLLNDATLHHITLHPRIGKQQYKGEADRDAFAAFYRECRHPLIYNGDVHTVSDIRSLEETFPRLAGVMLGRGLLARPWLAAEYMQGYPLAAGEQRMRVKTFHDRLLHDYESRLQGEAQLLGKLKPHWEYLCPDVDKKLKKAIRKVTRMEVYLNAVKQIFEY